MVCIVFIQGYLRTVLFHLKTLDCLTKMKTLIFGSLDAKDRQQKEQIIKMDKGKGYVCIEGGLWCTKGKCYLFTFSQSFIVFLRAIQSNSLSVLTCHGITLTVILSILILNKLLGDRWHNEIKFPMTAFPGASK